MARKDTRLSTNLSLPPPRYRPRPDRPDAEILGPPVRSDGPLQGGPFLFAGLAAETVMRVVVDQPHCLHERINRRRPDKAKSALAQVLTQRARRLGLARDVAALDLPPHRL